MERIIYQYIDYKNEIFNQVIELRYKILFEPYGKIEKYNYDDLDPISEHLVALDNGNGKVAGYSRLTNFNGKGEITNVVVNPEYINNGIGSRMLNKHILKAKESNIKSLCLHARVDTVEFYKKAGFECKGEAFKSEKSGLMLQNMHR